MSKISPKICNLAKQLIGLESAESAGKGPTPKGVMLVCDKLREYLIRLAGMGGYVSLLSRALTLAKAQSPSLNEVKVMPDGSLSGFDNIEPGAGLALVSELLELLITFIGISLSLRILQEIWPDAKLEL